MNDRYSHAAFGRVGLAPAIRFAVAGLAFAAGSVQATESQTPLMVPDQEAEEALRDIPFFAGLVTERDEPAPALDYPLPDILPPGLEVSAETSLRPLVLESSRQIFTRPSPWESRE